MSVKKYLACLANILAMFFTACDHHDPRGHDTVVRHWLRVAVLDYHKRTGKWPNGMDVGHEAQVFDHSILMDLSPKIPEIKWDLERHDQFVADPVNDKPYILLIDADGDHKVGWNGTTFEVLDRVRIISEEDVRNGKLGDDTWLPSKN